MANTTNLDLVKPAGTDYALVSVINGNSDKIDAFAGTTNTAIENLENITWEYLANGTDFNNVTTPGSYYFYTNQNQPVGGTTSASWGVIVFANPQGTIVKQIAYEMGNGNDVVYQRRFSSNAWTDWDSLKAKASFSATGSTGNGQTTMSVTLPVGAKFDSTHNLFVTCAFRGANSIGAEGFALLKNYNNVVYEVQKLGMTNATNYAYDSTTRTLTFTTSSYISCLVIGGM